MFVILPLVQQVQQRLQSRLVLTYRICSLQVEGCLHERRFSPVAWVNGVLRPFESTGLPLWDLGSSQVLPSRKWPARTAIDHFESINTSSDSSSRALPLVFPSPGTLHSSKLPSRKCLNATFRTVLRKQTSESSCFRQPVPMPLISVVKLLSVDQRLFTLFLCRFHFGKHPSGMG